MDILGISFTEIIKATLLLGSLALVATGILIHNDKLILYFSNIESGVLVYYWKTWGQ